MEPLADNRIVVDPQALKSAEAQLAEYIGARVNPALTKNLMLELQTVPVQGSTELLLRFKGEMVNANSALLAEQAMLALANHPAFARYFSGANAPHAARPPELSGDEMYVRFPALPIAQYASLIQQMSGNVSATAAGGCQAGCACNACAPSVTAATASTASAAHAMGCGCNSCVAVTPSTTIEHAQATARAVPALGVAV